MTEHETYVLEEAIETVYERPDQHGKPEDTFGLIAEFWSSYLGIDVSKPDVSKLFILMKIARSAEGVYDEDNPEDVAGYAENWARLEEEEQALSPHDEYMKNLANGLGY